MTRFSQSIALLGFVGIAAAVPFKDARAAVIAVTTTQDELNADGDCSLREAVRSASLDTAQDACAAGTGGDTVVIPAGTYALTLAGTDEDASLDGDLDFADAVSLVGAGSGLTVIDGSGISGERILTVLADDFTVSGMTLRNADAAANDGGAISNEGNSATLSDVVFENNHSDSEGGAVYNLTTMTLEDCVVSGNTASAGGGGISHAAGSMTVRRSVISGNEAVGGGGGINSGDNLSIVQSTVAGNNADGQGGGLNVQGGTSSVVGSAVSGNISGQNGGGVNVSGGNSLTLRNVTVSGNSARFGGGGIRMNSAGSLILRNVTVANNDADSAGLGAPLGGGLRRDAGTVDAANSLFAGNLDLAGAAHADCSGTIQSLGHNLVQDAAGCSGLVGTDFADVAALIQEFGDNGGPTNTHALGEESPAIDAGDDAVCELEDQRGFARPADGNGDGIAACDIGAFEAPQPAVIAPPAPPPDVAPVVPIDEPLAEDPPKDPIVPEAGGEAPAEAPAVPGEPADGGGEGPAPAEAEASSGGCSLVR